MKSRKKDVFSSWRVLNAVNMARGGNQVKISVVNTWFIGVVGSERASVGREHAAVRREIFNLFKQSWRRAWRCVICNRKNVGCRRQKTAISTRGECVRGRTLCSRVHTSARQVPTPRVNMYDIRRGPLKAFPSLNNKLSGREREGCCCG